MILDHLIILTITNIQTGWIYFCNFSLIWLFCFFIIFKWKYLRHIVLWIRFFLLLEKFLITSECCIYYFLFLRAFLRTRLFIYILLLIWIVVFLHVFIKNILSITKIYCFCIVLNIIFIQLLSFICLLFFLLYIFVTIIWLIFHNNFWLLYFFVSLNKYVHLSISWYCRFIRNVFYQIFLILFLIIKYNFLTI